MLHPLAKYPGPLVAALTDWYTVYWIADGGRHLELDKQHKKYGEFCFFLIIYVALSLSPA